MRIQRSARTQLAELTGMTVESMTSAQRSGDGWTLELEVPELARAPDTVSLLGGHEVLPDEEGELTGHRRVRGYERGRADPHQRG
ncbi:hypothetical protein Sm713_34250 [Streptomyces sp. TS71-3]|nr:hypothetical protein Sm713_34250 [Streptomyces sp. TS71-3]